MDDRIAFDWGYDSIGPGFPKDHFSARWSFYYKSKEDGLLRISMGGDDGYRIFVNDKLLTGDWGNHAYSHREKTFKVEKGQMYHFVLEYFDNISSAAVSCNISRLNEKKLYAGLAKVDNIVYSTGFNSNVEGEGFDRSFRLTGYQEEMIERLSMAGKKMTVVLNAGGGVDMSRWLDKIDALLMAWYPGQEGGTALSEILTGKISPSGKLPISIEKNGRTILAMTVIMRTDQEENVRPWNIVKACLSAIVVMMPMESSLYSRLALAFLILLLTIQILV